jgi:hypothetical protein
MAMLPEQKKGVVLLFNACHHWMTPVQTGLGHAVAAMLAGETPEPLPVVRLVPWLLRGQLLILGLPIVSVIATLRLARRASDAPVYRPRADRGGSLISLLAALLPNLGALLAMKPLLGKRRGYLRLYMPDYAWLAQAAGGAAALWSVLGTWLLLRVRRRRRARLQTLADEPQPGHVVA